MVLYTLEVCAVSAYGAQFYRCTLPVCLLAFLGLTRFFEPFLPFLFGFFYGFMLLFLGECVTIFVPQLYYCVMSCHDVLLLIKYFLVSVLLNAVGVG